MRSFTYSIQMGAVNSELVLIEEAAKGITATAGGRILRNAIRLRRV